jgi:NAD(P)-dependent dehydrogenase (short-subunit alcohol dehydrogenase family)
LTNLLLPRITERVVTVTSGFHRFGKINMDDLNYERRRYSQWGAYAQSKLANLLFTLELERRLIQAGSAVRATAAHPGYAATNLQGGTGNPIANLLGRIGNVLVAQSDRMGALPTLYAATADIPGGSMVGPANLNHTRGYPVLEAPSAAALDGEVARRLWDRSEELTNVHWPLAPAPA